MPTKEDLRQALEIAVADFHSKDLYLQATRSGAQWIDLHPDRSCCAARLFFLGRWYEIFPNGDIVCPEAPYEPALWERIVLLHYFNRADGALVTQHLTSFAGIPDGRIYATNFERRVVLPLLQRYGQCPEEIIGPAQRLKGTMAPLGDLAVRIPVLPKVPVTIVLWRGDSEFAPRISVLFDRSITHYLPTEDIVLTAQMMALKLVSDRIP